MQQNNQPNNQRVIQQSPQHHQISSTQYVPETQIDKLLESMAKSIPHLPTLIKRIIFYKSNLPTLKEEDQLVINQQQIHIFQTFKIKLATCFTKSSLLLRGNKMNLGIRVGKMQDEQEERQFEMNVQIQKVVNYIISLGQYIKLINEQKYFDTGFPSIHQNFIISLIQLTNFIISEYKAEQFFNKEANELIKAILWTIDVYLNYKTVKARIVQTKRDIQKRFKRKCKRQNGKKSQIKKQKLIQKEKLLQIQQNIKIEDDVDENDRKDEQKNESNRIVIKKQKRSKKKKENSVNQLKKSPSQVNLHDSQVKVSQKVSYQTHNKNGSRKHKDNKMNAMIQQKVQCFLKNTLVNANKGLHPLFQNQTFQYLIYFISRHMPVNILQTPPYKKFQIKLLDILEQLLKVKINGRKVPGYHFSLCKIGLQLLEDSHLKISYETCLKRYMFENLQNELKLKAFYDYLRSNYEQVPKTTSNVAQIVLKEADKKSEEFSRYPFTQENCLQFLRKSNHQNYIVKLKEGVEFHLINMKGNDEKRKPSTPEENPKGIKISDYVPEGDVFHFISLLVQRSIVLLFQEIDASISSLNNQSVTQTKENSLSAFNIKHLLQTLQFMIRQSPIFCPFIAKFKCKKIILAQLAKHDKYKNIQEVNRIILKLLIGKQEMSQNMQQIGFLSVIIRLFSPFILNSISGIVFEICLDNTPLVQSNAKGNFSSFGSVARRKALEQIDNILFINNNSQNLFKKLCLLNLISVMLHMKEMAKLFIENNFVGKLYKLYTLIMNKIYENQETNAKLFKRLYIKKIILPFYLTPLEILQEVNINLHSNKKNKHKQLSVGSVLNIETINAQLCPKEYLQRYFFKKDCPFNEVNQHKHDQPEIEQQQQNPQQFSNQSSGDSNSQDSFSEHSSDEFDFSIQNNDVEGYQSIQGQDGHLLSMQWDYSNSFNGNMHQYPNQDDQVIEEYSGSDILMQEMSENEDDLSDMEQMEGLQDGDLQQGQDDDLDLMDDSSDLLQSFNSVQHNEFLNRNDVDIRLRFNQEELYDNIYNIVNFEDIESLSRISKVQGQQIHNLRLLLRLEVYPKRQLNKKQLPKEEMQKRQAYVKEKSCLLISLKDDDLFKSIEFVENRQIYQYDSFANEQPKASIELQQIYSDRQIIDDRRPRNCRRNGILQMERRINIMDGWNIVREASQDLSSLSQESQLMRIGRVVVPNQEQQGQAMEDQLDQIIPYGMRPRFQPPILTSPLHRPIERVNHDTVVPLRLGQTFIRQPRIDFDQNQRLQTFRSNEMGPINMMLQGLSPQQIQRVITASNMNMTVEDFRGLSAEVQEAIVFNTDAIHEQYGHGQIIHERLRRIPSQSDQISNEDDQSNQNEEPQGAHEIRMQQQAPNIPAQSQSESSENHQNIQGAAVEDYKRISLDYLKIINKDMIELNNKQGKNDSKYYELQQIQLERLLQMLYIMDEKQHVKFPYPLFQTMCINKNNLQKLVSVLFVLLQLTPAKVQSIKYQVHPIITLNILGQSTQIWKQYSKHVYSNVSLKILHILKHLTKVYSISMHFFKVNNRFLSSFVNQVNPIQNQYSSFELMFELLTIQSLSASAPHLEFITSILDNITVHHFYKFIHLLIEGTTSQQAKSQHLKLIKIKEKSGELLGSLLQNILIKEKVAVVSSIIMRLSVHEQNIDFFIQYISKLVHKLSIQALQQIQRLKTEPTAQCNFKIINLMYIFYEMVKAYKTYPASSQKHESVLASFRKIVEYKELHLLCEQSIKALFDAQNPLQSNYGQIVDCFFILFQIVKITSNTFYTQKQETHNHIAELYEMKVTNNELLKVQHEDIVLNNFNFSALWKQAIGNINFKTYLNNNIKIKITEANKRFQNINNAFLDIPILKIAALNPQILTFQNKLKIFRAEVKKYKGKAKYEVISIPLSRQEVFQESFDKIMGCNAEQLKGKIKIQFLGEEGQDAGGLARQWFQLLSRQMFNPNYGLFKEGSGGHTYHPSSMSYVNNQHLDYFKFIGRITGKALLDGYLLDAYFTPAFYKHILNLPIKFQDMEEEDYQFFKSLTWILENKPIQEYLQLNFTYECDHFGEVQNKDLFPGGSSIIVTEQNKVQYVQLLSYAKMATNIKAQLQSFLTGLHQMMPHRFLRIFNEKQLEIMISGRPTIDIEDLKKNTQYVNYTKNDQIIKWLFELLQSFDMEMRTAFIQFVTGSSRVPAQGFKDLRGMNGVQKFNIHKEFQDLSLPRAHTCFNQLDLPNYKTREVLIQKLTYAITQGKEGFGII